MAFSQHDRGKKPAPKSAMVGRFPAVNVGDSNEISAVLEMKRKLERLFALKKKFLLSGALEQLTPIQFMAQSPELRASLQKIMPEKLAKPSTNSNASRVSAGDASLISQANPSLALGDNEDVSDDVEASGAVLMSAPQSLPDTRAAKSVIRLSNAIMPLLAFYTDNMPTLKRSSSPSKAGKRKQTPSSGASVGSASAATAAVPINIQEVHHAFHGVLKQIERLESSAGTTVLHAAADREREKEKVAPPPLVDVMMRVSQHAHVLCMLCCCSLTSHIYCRRTTKKCTRTLSRWRSSCTACTTGAIVYLLEPFLRLMAARTLLPFFTTSHFYLYHLPPLLYSKKRQYENLQEQLRALDRVNSQLKNKLATAEAQRDEFKQLAIDREKQLQAALVHLGAAQVGCRCIR